SVIYFRPAGTYGDAFRSLHVDYVLVDEGAWLTEKAWKALRQCLKAKGNDHIIDAVRCALLVREQLQDGGGWDSSTIELVTPLQTEPLNW
ncbi:MAG: hypothetical protein HZA78_11285, partial [Candidatus Schekmanbacteria bacterium]|nr:hypothetical protein [Candidatus Schekmanbacteria bacterium]